MQRNENISAIIAKLINSDHSVNEEAFASLQRYFQLRLHRDTRDADLSRISHFIDQLPAENDVAKQRLYTFLTQQQVNKFRRQYLSLVNRDLQILTEALSESPTSIATSLSAISKTIHEMRTSLLTTADAQISNELIDSYKKLQHLIENAKGALRLELLRLSNKKSGGSHDKTKAAAALDKLNVAPDAPENNRQQMPDIAAVDEQIDLLLRRLDSGSTNHSADFDDIRRNFEILQKNIKLYPRKQPEFVSRQLKVLQQWIASANQTVGAFEKIDSLENNAPRVSAASPAHVSAASPAPHVSAASPAAANIDELNSHLDNLQSVLKQSELEKKNKALDAQISTLNAELRNTAAAREALAPKLNAARQLKTATLAARDTQSSDAIKTIKMLDDILNLHDKVSKENEAEKEIERRYADSRLARHGSEAGYQQARSEQAQEKLKLLSSAKALYQQVQKMPAYQEAISLKDKSKATAHQDSILRRDSAINNADHVSDLKDIKDQADKAIADYSALDKSASAHVSAAKPASPTQSHRSLLRNDSPSYADLMERMDDALAVIGHLIDEQDRLNEANNLFEIERNAMEIRAAARAKFIADAEHDDVVRPLEAEIARLNNVIRDEEQRRLAASTSMPSASVGMPATPTAKPQWTHLEADGELHQASAADVVDAEQLEAEIARRAEEADAARRAEQLRLEQEAIATSNADYEAEQRRLADEAKQRLISSPSLEDELNAVLAPEAEAARIAAEREEAARVEAARLAAEREAARLTAEREAAERLARLHEEADKEHADLSASFLAKIQEKERQRAAQEQQRLDERRAARQQNSPQPNVSASSAAAPSSASLTNEQDKPAAVSASTLDTSSARAPEKRAQIKPSDPAPQKPVSTHFVSAATQASQQAAREAEAAAARNRRAAELAEAARIATEDAARAEAARFAAEQAETARVAAEEEAARVAAEQEAARVAAEREAARVAAEQAEAARLAAEQESARIAAEQEAARVAAEQEAARLAAEREAASVAAEQEAARLAAEREAARVAAEREAARVAAEREAARFAAEQAEAARLAAEEEAARVAAEQEAARLAAEREAARVAAEQAEAARLAAEQEAALLAAEEEARVAAEEAARVAAEQAEAARVAAEREAARLAAEEAARSLLLRVSEPRVRREFGFTDVEFVVKLMLDIEKIQKTAAHYAVRAELSSKSTLADDELKNMQESSRVLSDAMDFCKEFFTLYTAGLNHKKLGVIYSPAEAKKAIKQIDSVMNDLQHATTQQKSLNALAYFSDVIKIKEDTFEKCTKTVKKLLDLDNSALVHATLVSDESISKDDLIKSGSFLAPNTARILKTTINTKPLFFGSPKNVNVVSVQRIHNDTFTTKIYYDPKQLSKLGRTDYIKLAVIEVENFRAANPTNNGMIVLRGNMDIQLVKAIVTYCELKQYSYQNKINSFTPTQNDIKNLEKVIAHDAIKIFDKAKALATPENQMVTAAFLANTDAFLNPIIPASLPIKK